jgi:hypothetical protein
MLRFSSLNRLLLPIILIGFMFVPPARAEVIINGFGDIVGSKSSSDYPVNNIGNGGRALSFDSESRLGLNLSAALGESLDFAGQIVGRGSDGGAYNLRADWVFLTYRPTDEVKFRIGRQILPLFLDSEQYDVGFTYAWSRLPFEVYGIDPVKAFTGISGIYTKNFGIVQVSGELYGGGADLIINGVTPSTGAVGTYSAKVNNSKGFTLDTRAEDLHLRLAYNGNSHAKLYLPGVATAYDLGTTDALTFGASYESKKLLLQAESVRFSAPKTIIGSATGAYGTLGYRVLPMLMPYITYSWLGNDSSTLAFYPGNLLPSATNLLQGQSSQIVGLNYHAGLALVVKAEFMQTAYRYVDNSLNFRANTVTVTSDFVF